MTQAQAAIGDGVSRDADGRLTEELGCIKCGYNLRGALAEGRCPECGLAVGRSAVGHYLRYCDPAWLRRVWGGLNRLGVVVLCAAGLAATIWLGVMEVRGNVLPDWLVVLLPVTFFCTGLVVGVHGIWKATSPDPAGLGGERIWSARRLTRGCLVALPVSFGVFALWAGWADAMVQGDHYGLSYRRDPLIVVTQGLNLLTVGLLIALPMLLLMHGRSLARRIPRPWLGRVSLGLAVWLGVCGAVFTWVLDDWFGWMEFAQRWYTQWVGHGSGAPNGPGWQTVSLYTSSPPQVGHFCNVACWYAGIGLALGVLGLPGVFFWYWPAMTKQAKLARATWAGLPWGGGGEKERLNAEC